MAVVRNLAVFIASVRLVHAMSLVQRYVEVGPSHGGDTTSLDVVQDTLGAVNDTIGKVSNIIGKINSTASETMTTFIHGFHSVVLGTLKDAAGEASIASPEISQTATNLIDLANYTLERITATLPSMYANIELELEKNLVPIEKIASTLTSEFTSTAQKVLDLSNLTNTSLLKKLKTPKHTRKAVTKMTKKLTRTPVAKTVAKTLQKFKKHSSERIQNIVVVKKHKSKHAMMLLEERALRGEETALSQVDQSVARKGSSSPCSKALKEIVAANVTLFAMEVKVQAYNDTAYSLFGTLLDTATSSLSIINSTVASALDGASDLPSHILSPVTDGLDKLFSVGDTFTSNVQDNLATLQDLVTDAVNTLDPVKTLADTLVEAVTQAQCDGACGQKEQLACQAAEKSKGAPN